MKYLMNTLSKIVHAALITLLVLVVPVGTATAEGKTGSAEAIELEAAVAAVDPQTREVSLTSSIGLIVTVFVPPSLDLENISVGNRATITYFPAVATDMRTPTDEELADPWVVVEGSGQTGESIGGARQVRAVVTVMAMDKASGIIAVTDSRDKMHFITNVEPEKFADLTEGQKVFLVFTQATVVTLET